MSQSFTRTVWILLLIAGLSFAAGAADGGSTPADAAGDGDAVGVAGETGGDLYVIGGPFGDGGDCAALGGTWDPVEEACHLASVLLEAGQTLRVEAVLVIGDQLTSFGTIEILTGAVVRGGRLTSYGTILRGLLEDVELRNYGVLDQVDVLGSWSGPCWVNEPTGVVSGGSARCWENFGVIQDHQTYRLFNHRVGSAQLRGALTAGDNRGYLQSAPSPPGLSFEWEFVNHAPGIVELTGHAWVNGGELLNHGTIVNHGTISFQFGGLIENRGALLNSGTVGFCDAQLLAGGSLENWALVSNAGSFNTFCATPENAFGAAFYHCGAGGAATSGQPAFPDTDVDADGVCDIVDCDPGSSEAWRAPDTVRDLRVWHDRTTGVSHLSWSPPGYLGGSTLTYDVFASPTTYDFLITGSCEATGLIEAEHDDDFTLLPGELRLWLVRAVTCAPGPVEPSSDGATRPLPDCAPQ